MLERLPDDKLAWKPHDKSMSLGGLATHLANMPHWRATILNERVFDLASLPPNLDEKTSRADILAFFDETTKRARGWMDKTDAEYLARVGAQSRRTGDVLDAAHRRVPQLRADHLIHHRGQLSVYLRLNDIPVPPIYGPTADEG